MTFFTQWPLVEPTIFDLRPQNLYLKHTKQIPFQSFNTEDKLWGGKETGPQLIYSTLTQLESKWHGSAHILEKSKQIIHISSQYQTDDAFEKKKELVMRKQISKRNSRSSTLSPDEFDQIKKLNKKLTFTKSKEDLFIDN